jgi:hypothetical protein
MNAEREDRERNDPGDAAFVARLTAAFAPPPMTPARRARFDARLAERVGRDRLRFVPGLAAGAAAAAAALFVISHLVGSPAREPVQVAAAQTAGSGSALAEAWGSADDFEESLPAEYQAIAGLLGEL